MSSDAPTHAGRPACPRHQGQGLRGHRALTGVCRRWAAALDHSGPYSAVSPVTDFYGRAGMVMKCPNYYKVG
ncbi:hypothetical protein QFZ22_001406 [Streptomyces canus]|uniref:Uncharacterized protein n=1 Tax=Streptomyces canus TaxID=58343 RepID=A0AAW8F5N5_9ACTN|nr:hypothetical protein [Streptomyces canus]MDQ0905421.1 hypothetical protein [Streptomyces canus]